MQKYKLPEQKNFILFGDILDTINRGGSWTLEAGYVDHANKLGLGAGTYVEYQIGGNDKWGKPVVKRFRFDESFRKVQTRPSDKSAQGISQYDFLRNHPGCLGSENGTYDAKGVQLGAIYKEYDPQKDAEVAFEAGEARINAQSAALTLDPQTLEEIANILGHFGEPDKAMRVTVIEFAGKRPSEFNELLNAGDRSFRAIVRKALAEGEFTKKGEMIFWGETLIGNSEDAAVSRLAGDQTMIDALKDRLKLSVETRATKPKNTGGRPRINAPK